MAEKLQYIVSKKKRVVKERSELESSGGDKIK